MRENKEAEKKEREMTGSRGENSRDKLHLKASQESPNSSVISCTYKMRMSEEN